ncbi:EpsG family protein [Chryseobacterium culicis]|uniref:EpsG family protein n=1 Tax=Chryseobacterium culicis TaxID=680127 RepID=UPI0014289D71|nr:EpsG family protein [Chryseobacterium culicis]
MALTILHLIVCFIVRDMTPFSINADYDAYYYGYGDLDFSTPWFLRLFREPYFYYLKSIAGLFAFDKKEMFNYIYYFNFSISALFFIWLAQLKDVALWKKVIFYVIYYFLFSFTVLRNSPAYILVTILFYYLQRDKRWYWGYLAFFAHISSIIALGVSVFKNKKPTFKFLIYAISACVLIFVFSKIPIFSALLFKFDAYSTLARKASISHIVFFLAFNCATIFVYFKNRKIVFNNVYILLYLICVVLFTINPVMFFRFSIYAISYLITSPTEKLTSIDKILNNAVFLLFFYFIYTFNANNITI